MATLTLFAICAAFALLAAGALAIEIVTGAGARAGHVAVAKRSSFVTLSPAPNDLALAQISFRDSGPQRLSARSLQVAVSGPFGDDYLAAAAAPRSSTPGVLRALVLLVNRPSPLLDPVSVRLRLTAQRSLGAPAVRTLVDPFARPSSGKPPALCDLRTHGHALSGSQLGLVYSRGTPLSGFDAASAVAQAYDAACGLPYASAFKQAVEQSSSGTGTPTPPAPQPQPPAPEPPVGKLPGEGCKPAPGYACPAAVQSTPATGELRHQ
ncbi:MAG TPA: hypothetical protein VK272_00810 [Solirubrobacteraceae bacterium]|nr:hypothetical protein [Solirubrobacteraceae bacterium]